LSPALPCCPRRFAGADDALQFAAARSAAIEPASPGERGFAGTARKAAYVGGVMEYTIGAALGDLLVVNMAVDRRLSEGADVMLKLANHGVVPIVGA
jgi:hypothetical protein